MPDTVVPIATLTTSQTQQTIALANNIANTAVATAEPTAFKYLAAFDGTNNDRLTITDSLPTNVGILEYFVSVNAINQSSGYFPGIGVANTLVEQYGNVGALISAPISSWLAPLVDSQAEAIAAKAYNDFAEKAFLWHGAQVDSGALAANDPGDYTSQMIAFSRGNASAAIFSQMLYEKGLVFTPDSGAPIVLAPPGQVGVSAAVLFDPVVTGVAGNLALAPNVENAIVIQARDEYRYEFKAAELGGAPQITTYVLLGATGNDTLDGGSGADTMTGGAGNDTYIFTDVGDAAIEAAGEGIDTICTAGTLILSANIENLTITGSGNGYGNALDNVLTGSATDNRLDGNGGNDKLNGMNGADTLNGGDGVDWLQGGVGNDTLNGGAGNDAFAYGVGDGADILSDTGGLETLLLYAGSSTLNNLTEDLLFRRVNDHDLEISLALNGGASLGSLLLLGMSNAETQIEKLKIMDAAGAQIGNTISLPDLWAQADATPQHALELLGIDSNGAQLVDLIA